jgi:hypothetical protein
VALIEEIEAQRKHHLQENSNMFAQEEKRYHFMRATAAMAVLVPALLLASNAKAACDPGMYGGVHVNVPAAMMHHGRGPDSIVGLWHAVLTSPDGFGYQSFVTWHADGLEFESADAPPLMGAVCVGVWRQEGRNVYDNHFGWTWDQSGLVPTGSFNLTETLTLNPLGNGYTGNFDFKTYDIHGGLSGDHKGTVAATRIGLNDHGADGTD